MTEVVSLLVPGLAVAVTSGVALGLGMRRGRLTIPRLLHAAAGACELLGLAAIFLAANVAVGLALVLAVRWWTNIFASAYAVQDVALVGLSLLQGLVFGLWRRR